MTKSLVFLEIYEEKKIIMQTVFHTVKFCNWCFSFAPDFGKLFGAQRSPSSSSLMNL